MRSIVFIFWVVSQILSGSVFAQNSKKDTNSWYSRLSRANVNEVREGKHLELAKNYSLENFIEYYVREGKERLSKKDGNLTIELLYKDSVFFYFGHLWSWGMQNFFKVKQNDLIGINYEELDDKQLRRRLIDEIVPVADKEKVEKKGWGCTTFNGFEKFTYKYLKDTKEIEIVYKWKSVCDFVARQVNKTYSARYNIVTKTFSHYKSMKGTKGK